MDDQRHQSDEHAVQQPQPEDELRLLRAVALTAAGAENLTAALEMVLRGVCEVTGWTLGQAWLPAAEGTLACSPAWWGCGDTCTVFRQASEHMTFTPGRGLVGQAWATGHPIWSRDATADPRSARAEAARAAGLHAGMAIPILAGSDVVGILEFFTAEERAEDAHLVTLIAALAAQLGGVVRRRQVEEVLRQSEARYRAVVEYAHDAIILMSDDGRVAGFNRAAECLFGYAAEEIIGEPLTRLLPERFRAAHAAAVRRYRETGTGTLRGRAVEVAGLRRDGTECPVELTVAAVSEGTSLLFAGILRNMTERAELEAERAALLVAEQDQARRLRELAALKADFTAMVAHELGTPVAAILRLTDMLATGALDGEAEARALATIRAEARTLRHLVADVRATAEIERDDFAVEIRPVPLGPILDAAAALARSLPGAHPVTVSAVEAQVWADPERIGQVLRNLLGNAARYSPDGAPIALRAVHDGERVRIAVTDKGYGIHPDDRARIFEKFGRGRDRGGRHVAGAGLGLYLSRRILQAHGSTLMVDSAPGEGSVFAFTLEVVP